MVALGTVLGPHLEALAQEVADLYLAGDLVIVAGAGVSRASGMPGWDEMVAALQAQASIDLAARFDAHDIEVVLTRLHGDDPISKADSLQRLLGAQLFRKRLHPALYPDLPSGEAFRPALAHWHIASLIDRRLMPNAFTSNFDDLLEDAKLALGRRSGRVRHFHGRLPQGWSRLSRLADPPVVTARDYMAAEGAKRYERLTGALRDKTALLVGFSLADPNLTRIIRDQARDCRAVVVASPGLLTRQQQKLRLDLLRRYWRGLNVAVTAIEAHEELAAFLLAVRRLVLAKRGRALSALGREALDRSVLASVSTWSGAREWRAALQDAVFAAKDIAEGVNGDRSLRAGFYAIEATDELVHVVSSQTTQRAFSRWPRRRLRADASRPWGAAGYSYAAGVPIASSATGPAFDRNVPAAELLDWQTQRATQRRLPASSVLCVPAWVRYRGGLVSVGVLYFSSARGAAFDDRTDAEELRFVLQLALGTMIRPENHIEGGPP